MAGCIHGICNGTANTCVCNEGWQGILCNEPICAQGCNLSNAMCTYVSRIQLITSYHYIAGHSQVNAFAKLVGLGPNVMNVFLIGVVPTKQLEPVFYQMNVFALLDALRQQCAIELI